MNRVSNCISNPYTRISTTMAASACVAAMFLGSAFAQATKTEPKAAKAAAVKPSTCSKINDKGTNPMKVKLTTSMGAITLELNKEKAPISTENFVKYVESGHYNGTIFHRVINNFMIQGGGFDKKMIQKSAKATVVNEANNGLKNVNGSIAMARTSDPQSASAQFFINVKDNDFLDFRNETTQGWGYAVFGKVTKGMDVVNKIKVVKTGNSGGMSDVPVEPVIIESAEIVEPK